MINLLYMYLFGVVLFMYVLSTSFDPIYLWPDPTFCAYMFLRKCATVYTPGVI